LGILDPKLKGMALRLKWLWLYRTDPSCSWGALAFKEDPITVAFFRASTTITVGDGTSMLFWSDPWFDGQDVSKIALELVQVVSKRCWGRLLNNAWIKDITGPYPLLVLV
jgi:hypothetical protein